MGEAFKALTSPRLRNSKKAQEEYRIGLIIKACGWKLIILQDSLVKFKFINNIFSGHSIGSEYFCF